MERKPYSFEKVSGVALEPPPDSALARRIEAASKTPEAREAPALQERRDDEARLPHALDAADLESLVAVIRNVEVIRTLEREASEVLEREVAASPEFERVLLTPQSPDKHAEGPFVEDHLRLMLVVERAVAAGKLRLETLPEFAGAINALGTDADRAYVRHALVGMEDEIRRHPAWFESFALYHDHAKPDTLGFDASAGSSGEKLGFVKYEKVEPLPKKSSSADVGSWEERKRMHEESLRRRYAGLLWQFGAEEKALLSSPAHFQDAFFKRYGISLTNYRHGQVGVAGDNRTAVAAAAGRRGLEASETEALITAIELHLEPHQRFSRGPDASGFADVLKKLSGHAREPREIAHWLRAGAMLDLLGTKRPGADGTLASDAWLTVNFILSEERYEEGERAAAKNAAYKAAARGAGFTAEWLIGSLGLEGRMIGEAQRAVEAAARSGSALELSPTLEPHRDAFEERVQAIKKVLDVA